MGLLVSPGRTIERGKHREEKTARAGESDVMGETGDRYCIFGFSRNAEKGRIPSQEYPQSLVRGVHMYRPAFQHLSQLLCLSLFALPFKKLMLDEL